MKARSLARGSAATVSTSGSQAEEGERAQRARPATGRGDHPASARPPRPRVREPAAEASLSRPSPRRRQAQRPVGGVDARRGDGSQVIACLDLVRREPAADLGVGAAARRGSVLSPRPGALGRALHQAVGLLAVGALGDHRQQQRLGVDHPAEQLEVWPHPVGVDLEAVAAGRSSSAWRRPATPSARSKTKRSALEWLMSRSCQRAMFSRPTSASARSRRAKPVIRSARTGLRLWGMALLPCWPAPNGSNASPTSVRCRWRTSTAIRSSVPPRMASAASSSACRSRLTTWVEAGSAAQAERVAHELLHLGADVGMRADRAGDLADRDPLPGARQPRLVALPPRRTSRPTLKPKVIGSAWIPWLRPTIGVDRCCTRHPAQHLRQLRAARPPRSAVASRSTTAVAVSSTSELVSPKCSQRPSGPSRSVTERRKAITSCCDSCSISCARAGVDARRPPSRIRSQSVVRHQARRRACASTASSSIRSHSSSLCRSEKSSRSSGSA